VPHQHRYDLLGAAGANVTGIDFSEKAIDAVRKPSADSGTPARSGRPSSSSPFLVPTAFMVHNLWRDDDAMTRQIEMSGFMKDLALAGGSLLAFALFASSGDEIGLQITDSLFDISL
jgi:hypothetical protein